MEVRVIGIDIAKRYFQIHGVDVAGDVVLRRKLSRDAFLKLIGSLSPCVVGMEAGDSYQHTEVGIKAMADPLLDATSMEPAAVGRSATGYGGSRNGRFAPISGFRPPCSCRLDLSDIDPAH